VAIAFVIFYFDDTVKYSKNLEKDLNMPVIGKIVHGEISQKKNKNGKSDNEVMLISMPKASASESIRNLRANLSFSSVDKGLKSLLVTSTNASEGKSFVSSNLATAYAQAGMNVVLIDGDLRKGRLHRVFKLRNVRGFSDLLIDKKSRSYDKYLKETAVEGLTVITRGTCPPNPSELLGSTRAKGVIKKLLEQFDMVIIDTPPLGAVIDAAILAPKCDGVVIVAEANSTSARVAIGVKKQLEMTGCKILGCVLNKVPSTGTSYRYRYRYYDEYEYKADPESGEKKRVKTNRKKED
jgi:capsular exopolysaccharide synthesis family protein